MTDGILSLNDRKSLHGGEYVDAFAQLGTDRVDHIWRHISLPHGGVVADFGCGNANLLPLIHDHVDRYVGVDFSEDFICAARKRQTDLGIANAEFHCGPIQEFGRNHENSFDAVFAFDLSEHVYDDEWQDIVRGMHAALKPGGKAYVHTPNRDFLIEIMKAHDFVLKQFPQHIAVRNGDHNADFFETAGFTHVSLTYLPHYNILRYLNPLAHLPVLGRYFRARLLLAATK